MTDSVLHVSANTTTFGDFLDKTLQMDLKPVLITRNADRFLSLRRRDIEVAQVDESNEKAVLKFATDYASRHRVAGVMSTSEYLQPTAARVARAVGLPAADIDSLLVCRNKARQRDRLAEYNILQPKYKVVDSARTAAAVTQDFGGDVVIKPLEGSGSVGVARARYPEAAAILASDVFARRTNERGQVVDNRALVEEYIAGAEFSIEIFDSQVVGVTRKLLGAPPFFVESGHTYPAEIDTRSKAKLEKIAIDAVSAIGLIRGPVHVEARLGSSGAVIIEVNPRLAGGFIPRLIELTGTDLVSRTIAWATGVRPVEPKTAFKAAAVRFLVPKLVGKLVKVTGTHEANAISAVRDVSIYADVGADLRLVGNFSDRIGHIIATGNSAGAADSTADYALAASVSRSVPAARRF